MSLTTPRSIREEQFTIGDIPATFTSPRGGDGRLPAVLLLHGTASHRDEVGQMFRLTADALAEVSIASLRIDFAGCGESNRPQTSFTVTSELADAQTAFNWLAEQPAIDPTRIVILGFSQGGMIAILLGGQESRAAGLVTWSSGVMPVEHRAAIFAKLFQNGETDSLFDMGFAQFRFSREWWDEFRTMDLGSAAAQFRGPVLAVSGSADEVVLPKASIDLIDRAPGADLTLVQIPGADHIFNVLATDGCDVSQVAIETTVSWLATRLTAATPSIEGAS